MYHKPSTALFNSERSLSHIISHILKVSMIKFFTLCILIGLFSLETAAQSSSKERINLVKAAIPIIEKLYQDFAEKNRIPGYAVGIVVDGELVYAKGAGFTEIAGSTKATEKSMFRIASMSKSVTAMGILALRKEGKLKLETDAFAHYRLASDYGPSSAHTHGGFSGRQSVG
jgi:CubicO group peptidase (beta-lactamase class C family)